MTGLARYAHWCNSSKNTIGVITFLLDLRTTPKIETHTCHCYQGQEPVAKHVTGPRRDPTTITLLNGHNSNAAPDDLLLYP